METKIGFIGGGNMAEALIKGLLSTSQYKKSSIWVSDIIQKRLNELKQRYKINVSSDNLTVAKECEIIILSVKPKDMQRVLEEISKSVSQKKIYISIAAGITTSYITSLLKKEIKLARVMPNAPCLVRKGVSAIFFNHKMEQTEREKVINIFNTVGIVEVFEDEQKLNAVTGLSGSGPGFVSLFIEALTDGGIKMGLSKDISQKLALATLEGTVKMIEGAGMSPSELKYMVSSPGGTTIEGIHFLEVEGVRGAVISAVEKATQKSKALSLKGD